MDRKTYLDKVTKKARNLNIAKLYFEDDKSTSEIRQDYPELTKQRIISIAHANKDAYKEETI